MELAMQLLKDYGPWGLVLGVLVYMVLQGQMTFRYPRPKQKNKDDKE